MRVTEYDKKLERYILKEQLPERDLIDILGKREDALEKMSERSGILLDSMLELMEITKGEKEELMSKIRKWDKDVIL